MSVPGRIALTCSRLGARRACARTFSSPSGGPDPSSASGPVKKFASQTGRRSGDVGRFGWKGVTALAASGVALVAYFDHEKRKMEELRKARVNESAGQPRVGGPFCLVDTNGRPVTDLDFRGKYLCIYFGYTFCPDVCPEELDKIAKVLNNLKKLYADDPVTTLFISCDPKRDSLASLKEYLKDFHPDIVGLSGTHSQIKQVAKAYRLYYSAPPRAVDDDDADYLVDHSIFFYFVGPDGKYIQHFGRQETAESITEKMIASIKK